MVRSPNKGLRKPISKSGSTSANRTRGVSEQDVYRKRIVAATVFLCLCFGIIITRLAFLQIVSAKDYRQLASDQYTLYKKLTPVRGEIKVVDKFATEPYTVASSIEKDLVFANPAVVQDGKDAADKLAPILGLKPEDIAQKLADKTKKYVPLKKQLSDDEVQK